jgi:hypothetical protein
MTPKVNIISEADALQTLRGISHLVLLELAHSLYEMRRYDDASAVYDAAYARWQLQKADEARDSWASRYERMTAAECMAKFDTPF